MELKHTKSLKIIEDYFININNNFLSKGNFIIDHFFYFMDDIYNYQKENNNLDSEGNVLFKKAIDDHFMIVYNNIKNLIRQKNNPNININNEFKQFILSNKDKIRYIVYKYKNVIAERTAEIQYNKFINSCSNFLEFYEQKTKKQIRNKIRSLLKILFSYDNKKYDKKLEARYELRNILHKLKKEFKKINGNNTKNLKEIKIFSMWKGIFQEFLEDKEIENAIDRYRTRYLKNNNIKYFWMNEIYSGMIQTNIISNMNFLRGIHMPENLCEEEMKKELRAVDEKIKRVGKDKPIVEFYKVEKKIIIEKYKGKWGIKEKAFKLILDDCLKNGMDSLRTNFVAINNQYSIDCSKIHEGLLSTTTNLDIANKYSIGKNNEYKNEYPVIFLINPNIGTEILHSILGDHRAFSYSEIDFTNVPPESIVGYFVITNYEGELSYTFYKNIYNTSNILKNKYNFIDKNGNKNELKNGEIYTKKDIENILMNSNKELKEIQKYYLLKSIEIAKYLLKIKNNPVDNSENLYDDVMKLFKGNEVQVHTILKNLSQLKKGDVDEILNTKKFYKEEYYSKLDIFYCDIISPFYNNTDCRFYPVANIYNYLKSNDKLKYINEEIEEGTAEWINKRLDFVNNNINANKGEFNKDNIYYETNNWINLINKENGKVEWFYKDVNKPLTKRKTKINIPIDPEPENFLKAKIVFRKFLDKYDLYGKMPPRDENGRNVLIIYNQLTEEQLTELEKNLKEAEIRPKLLSCSEYTCDIAIKNSLYLYFKCDGFEYYDKNDKNNKEAYRNIQQVEYMDKVRQGIYDNDEDTSIGIYRNYINSTKNNFSKDNYFKNYSNDYFEYLGIIRKCNAVQRQLIDMIFRVELMAEKGEEDENGKKIWNKELFKYLTVDFIETRLNLIKAFAEKTKDIDEIELRKLLNNLIKEMDENYEPKLEKECIEYVNSIKKSLKNKEEKNNDKIQFNNKLKNANDNINEKLNEKIDELLNEISNS